MGETAREKWARFDELRQRYDVARRDESHLNYQRSLYWCREYRKLAGELVEFIDDMVKTARERRQA